VVYALRRGGNEIQQLTVQQVESSAETTDQGPRIQAGLMTFLLKKKLSWENFIFPQQFTPIADPQ
jgi:hypothetical protein